MKRNTSAARALVGCLALSDGATTNQAFKLAGYELRVDITNRRFITRNGRTLKAYRFVREANEWLERLGRKLVALGAGKKAA